MAGLLTTDIKDIFTIKLKPRQDDYTDQFSRIFMVKVLIVCSLVMGVDWFQDSVNCMVLNTDFVKVGPEFIHSACWIQGYYIYPQLVGSEHSSHYYGIPKKIQHDGTKIDGWNMDGSKKMTTCSVKEDAVNCRQMTKLYYHQYQWMPFYIASIAVAYYLPYILFQIVNTDMVSLRDNLSNEKIDPSDIVNNFFNYNVISLFQMRFRVLMNLVVKCIYLGVNLSVFQMTNVLLNGDFKTYGTDYINWIQPLSKPWLEAGATPKPGNVLLPTFGFCDINEKSANIIFDYKNTSKFICEFSLNVIYQYIFVILWFLMITGIFVSACGIVLVIAGYTTTTVYFIRSSPSAKVFFQALSFREHEYLTFIRRSDSQLYHDVMDRLRSIRPGLQKFAIKNRSRSHPVPMAPMETNITGSLLKEHKESNLTINQHMNHRLSSAL